MSLLDAIRSAVNIADGITKPLQPTVTYYRANPLPDSYSTENFDPPVSLPALVEWKEVRMPTSTGVLLVTKPVVTFLSVADVAAATEGLGFGSEDKLVLSDGTSGPIMTLDGALLDAGTNRPILTQVYIG